MKKISCLIALFLVISTVGCSVQTPKSNSSVPSPVAVTSSITQNSSSKSSNVITQPKSFADIDMVTFDTGYAITKDFHVVRTSDGGSSWTDILTQKNQIQYFYYPALFAVGSKTVYVAYYTATGIEVEKSIDADSSWSKSEIKMQVSDWNSGYGGSLVLSFINESDGFLITSTSGACGQMARALYRTTDGGNNWTFVGKSADPKLTSGGMTGINGYTTGMGFSSKNVGYITCTYRITDIPVYKTVDMGKNWSVASLPLPKKYTSLAGKGGNYVDAYPPYFFGNDNENAKMELRFVHNDVSTQSDEYVYSSNDGGTTWHIDGISNMLMNNYCFVDNKNGFGLDDNGTLYITKDGGTTWVVV